MTPARRGALDQLAERLLDSHAAGAVERCHGIRHHGSYPVSSHSWGVAMLIWYIWPERFLTLVVHALAHDIPELWTGDIPSPTIRELRVDEKIAEMETAIFTRLRLPNYSTALQGDDLAALLFCDRLEFLLWAHDQRELGNRRVERSITTVTRYLQDSMASTPAPAADLFGILVDRRATQGAPSFSLSQVMKKVD
jgi:hypothetical protein